jgi:hypothetical protein
MKLEGLKLKSIKEEAADCRKAFKGFAVGGLVLHLHHEMVCETLIQPIEDRIAYILTRKPKDERALRLRLCRPVPAEELKASAEFRAQQKASAKREKADAELRKAEADADLQKVNAEWKKLDAEWKKANAELRKASRALREIAHQKFCIAGCPWNGKTIFP